MSSFRIFSDLHLEFLDVNKFNDFLEKSVLLQKTNKTDFLILAGDITTLDYIYKLKNLLEKNVGLYKYIFYVVGNHEFYTNSCLDKDLFKHSNNDFYKYVIKEFEKVCGLFENVIFLNNSYCEIEVSDDKKIMVYGTPLWTNVDENTYKSMNDRLTLERKTIIDEHFNSISKLNEFLEIDKDEKTKVVVITHHLPLEELVDVKFKSFSKYNSGFASNVAKELIFNKKIDYWIYGHTHLPSKKQINKTQFLCNPFGYPSENGHYKAGHDLTFFSKYDMKFIL